jgi:asparagine N-glycosylation enzyme membrane subunit Stt3
MNKTMLALGVICLVAVAVRLYPTVVSGLPFSVDAWPLIRNTELLLQNTPTSITGLMFDGYNNYWPGCQLFGAVFSQVTSLPVADAMAWGIPFAAALAIPIFFILVRKITQNTTTAAIAALLLATAFPYALFTAV